MLLRLLLPLALATSAPAALTTVTFDTADAPGDGQGWWTTLNSGSPENYIFLTGYAYATGLPYPQPILEHRGHLSFMVTGVTDPIVSATLRLSQWGAISNGTVGAGNVTLGLFDVSTDANVLNSSSGAQASIFADLGSGTSYGSKVIATQFSQTRVLEIPLNSAAIAAIQNNAVFSVGMAMLDGNGSQTHYLFGNTGLVPSPFVHELRIVTIPEPATFSLAGAGLLLSACRRRRRVACEA